MVQLERILRRILMSFNTLKKDQLKAVATGFGLDVADNAKVDELKAAIAEADYIQWDEAVTLLKNEGLWEEEDEKKEEAAEAEKQAELDARPKDTLIRMYRDNHSYEIRGYRFTKKNPYALVTAEDAEAITEADPDGFRYATPKEAIEFYG
jgi:hypothetical protein